jgi:hypothetical protein
MFTRWLIAALALTALANTAVANPQKSHGMATVCWSRGHLTKAKIGHQPAQPCGRREQELKLQIQDIPNMRELPFHIKVPDGASPDALLFEFGGFLVTVNCSSDYRGPLGYGESQGPVATIWDIIDPEYSGHGDEFIADRGDAYVVRGFLHPNGVLETFSIDNFVAVLPTFDGFWYFSGTARITYTREAMTVEEFNTISQAYSKQANPYATQ